jgi:hypothetical protein
MAKDLMQTVDATFTDIFVKKLPPLPENAKEAIVKVSPWIALIIIILTAPIALSIFGLGALLSPLAVLAPASYSAGVITMALALFELVLLAIAFTPLKKREKKGWTYLFYSQLVALASSFLSVSLSSILAAAIGFYILYQIKPKYN